MVSISVLAFEHINVTEFCVQSRVNSSIVLFFNDDGTLLSFQLKLLSFGLNSIQDNILSYVQLVAVVVC